MWASWGVLIIIVAVVASVFALGGWVFAVPLGLLLGGGALAARAVRQRSGAEEVSELREQARGAAPLDKGGIEFTDRDRETLSS